MNNIVDDVLSRLPPGHYRRIDVELSLPRFGISLHPGAVPPPGSEARELMLREVMRRFRDDYVNVWEYDEAKMPILYPRNRHGPPRPNEASRRQPNISFANDDALLAQMFPPVRGAPPGYGNQRK